MTDGQQPGGTPPNGAPAPPPPPPAAGGGYPGQPYRPAKPPSHPRATTALVLGIVSIAGGAACVLPVFAAPFAWVIGARAVREIDADPTRYSGRSEANAGKILGIVGTVLGVLIIIGIVLLVVLAVTTDVFDDTTHHDHYDYHYDYDYFLRGALSLLGR